MIEQEPFDFFYSEGYITEVVRTIRSGKEAAVWLCRANPSTTGVEWLALKVYHPPERRNFRDASVYKAGRVIGNERDRRAMGKRTAWGRTMEEAWWHGREWENLELLHAAGVDVPKPVANGGDGILMEYIGDLEQAAPQLRQSVLSNAEARESFERIMWNIERMLACNVVHGDLSPFNVLWWNGRVRIIDVPQAVDPRSNRNAEMLLTRDVENICRYFERYGIRSDAPEIARGLWTAFLFADLL